MQKTELDRANKDSFCRISAVFLLGAGQTTLLVSLPAIMAQTGFDYVLLSAMVALGTGLFIFSAPLWGKCGDRYGRKSAVLVGVSAIAISFALIVLAVYGLTANIVSREVAIALLFIARTLYGLLASGLYPAVQAWVIDDHPVDRARALSGITASINAGRFTGPLIAALVIDFGSALPVACVALLATLLACLMLPGQAKRSAKVNVDCGGDFRQLLSATWPLLLLACSVTTLFGFLQYVTGPKLQQTLNDGVMTSKVLSMLMMLAALTTVVVHLSTSRWVKLLLINTLKVGSVLLLSGSLLMIAGSGLFWLATGLVISAAAVTLLTPTYTALASEHSVGLQGVLTGTLSMIHTVGYTLGALLAGLIGQMGDWHLAFFVTVIASITVLITFLWVDSPHATL